MVKKVRKRDGRVVKFDKEKIIKAIWKAVRSVGGKNKKRARELGNIITKKINKVFEDRIPQVEDIQDIVEKVLIEEGHAKTAKAYILYRKSHQDLREVRGLFDTIEVVEDYVGENDWAIKENANMGFSLQGLNNYISEKIVKKYWLRRVYPEAIRDAHNKCDIHLHDLGTLGPYTYFGKEVIIAKLNNKIITTSFQDLYELIESDEKTLSKKDKALAKHPDNLRVLDKDGWVEVTKLVKKKKDREMRFIKNEGGRSVIVTEDHPMVIGKGEFKEAKNIEEEKDKLLTVDIEKIIDKGLFEKKEIYLAEELIGKEKFFVEGMPCEEFEKYEKGWKVDGVVSTSNNSNSLPNKIELTENLGYLIGFYLAEGSMSKHKIRMKQKNTKGNKEIFKRLKKAAWELGCRLYTKENGGNLIMEIVNSTFVRYLLKKVLGIDGVSRERKLPNEILSYNKDFVKGIIGGVVDGDGSIASSGTSINIRISSRTLLEQLSLVLNLLGFRARDKNLEGVETNRVFKGRKIKQNYPLYGISFRIREKKDLPSVKYKNGKSSSKAWRKENYDWHKVLNNELTKIQDEYIYDITTKSNTLLVNGMWNHNCVGWDLKDLLLQGFTGVPRKIQTKPAKHLRVALGQIVNFFYTLQGEAAGAQAFSNFDTLLAPFIRYDNLDYKEVKQAMQEFCFNMAVPTRVGFQCMSEDTEILTPEGWTSYDELKKEDIIKTFNVEEGIIEDKPIKKLFKRHYQGKMYNLKNNFSDQLISPKHRVINKTSDGYSLDPIENFTEKVIVPISKKEDISNFSDFEDCEVLIKKVDYSGIIWCPNTDNETVIARRNGKVFITGNTPFTNITMDLKVPDFMKDEPVIIGGKPQKETYGNFKKEMAMLNKAFAEVMMEGDAKGRLFTFPIPTYNITKDFDWENPDYDPIWKMTAKYGIPYFSNFVNSDMKPEDARSMCCRLRLNQKELRKRGGGLFGANPLTGSIGVVTINMPRIAFTSLNKKEFFDRTGELMELAKESLEIKRKALENFTEKGLYPYSRFYLRNVKKRFGNHWQNHFSTIGLLGMNEAIENFMPGENIGTKKGREFAERILDYMREKLEEYQKETGNIYNLEATPAEGTTYRFAKEDKKRFARIKVANEEAVRNNKGNPYYTNSTQLPVNYTDDLFKALELQDPLQIKYTGGTVFHGFIGEKLEKEAVKMLVRRIANNFSLPYYTITPSFSICPIHGYVPGEHKYCPKCELLDEKEMKKEVIK